MTNEEAKQEAIKNAYGDKWGLVKKLTPKNGNDDHDLIENGFFKLSFLKLNSGSHLDYFPTNKYHYSGSNIENGYVIPLSILGLHGNNGWIRIEPDGSNLPTDGKELYKVGKLYDDGYFRPHPNPVSLHILKTRFETGVINEYKPITPEKPPIY